MNYKVLKELAQEIAKSISEIIGYHLLITDEFGIIIGCSDDINRLETLHRASLEVIKSGKPKFHDLQEAQRLEVKPGYTAPIQLANKVVGTVAIGGEPEDVGKFISIVKKQVEILLRQEIILKSSLLRERALQNLIQEISVFDPDTKDEGLLIIRGQELGYNLTRPYIAIVIDLYQFSNITQEIYQHSSIEDSPEMMIQLMKIRVDNTIKNAFNSTEDISTSIANDKFVVLHAINQRQSENEIIAQVKKKCFELEINLQKLDTRATMGIGSVSGNISQLRNSYREAWRALTIGKRNNRLPMIFSINDLYLEELLSSVNKNISQKFVVNVLYSLQKQSDWDELSRTICVWCESGFSPINTSKNLDIHKNTLFYRLTKIEQISGFNLRNFRESITLYFAVKVQILNNDLSKKMKQV
ncbi:MAG TPA: hypothetical protein DEF89_20405 [Desulfosporosinus sp.]|nr:hypothetical protein [Desulfosporosinus sp.]